MYDDYHTQGYEPLAINLSESNDIVKSFARQYDFTFLRDAGTVWNLYKINGYIPLNYVIDTSQSQLVVGRMEGFTEPTIRGWIESYLTGISEDKGQVTLRPINVRHNPTHGQVVIQAPVYLGVVTARIYSTNGQLVRVLKGTGRAGVTWNLQDNLGQRVANGVYVCQLNNTKVNILVSR